MFFSFCTPGLGSGDHPKGPYSLPFPFFPGHFPPAFLPDFLGASREMSSRLLSALVQSTS